MQQTLRKELIVPCIHLNGTSAGELKILLSQAWDAIDSAATALRQTAPNGRDYYCHALGARAMPMAIDQHRARLKSLAGVQAELETIMTGIDNLHQTMEVFVEA